MLKPVYKVRAIMDRYSCSAGTARKYMRQMRHTENPLTVTEEAIVAWERSKEIPAQNDNEGHMVPRRNEWKRSKHSR